ncbi:MAG TPA: chromosomal replication initiator protein DnaA [Phycisphaerae bacterium]|nr:chromosomal replication initiator protein DnaA [Phycisphaerae bacterium]HNU46686.1 chromosomal replication initiator protein DnaA [Phycisphaerae bacterium]
MVTCADDAVARLAARIAEKVGPQRYGVWFKNVTRFTFADGYLRVSAPNPFIAEWIERHFAEAIGEAAREVAGQEFTLSFTVEPALAKGLGKRQPDRQVDYIANNPERVARLHKQLGGLPAGRTLRGKMEDFVVGPCNQLAYAAALSAIEHPGEQYNPLFVHGGCGVGKTHLLQGIANALQERDPRFRCRYVSGEEFTNDYVYAIKAKEQEAFRDRYRNLDVLIIDDVHFLANKRGTQEEFLHTYQSVEAAGKQVVLASDASPKMIGHFSESLVSRFASGMVVRIDAPDASTRAEVLRRRARRMQVEVGEAVIQHIAANVRSNMRELEGALLRVVHQARQTGEALTVALAERALRELVRQTAPVVMLADIESSVAIFFGLNPADLHTSRKTRTIALARAITMYLSRKHTTMSYPEIGRFMGNKNHSTVILANRRISGQLQANCVVRWMTPVGQRQQNLAELIQELEEQFTRKGA